MVALLNTFNRSADRVTLPTVRRTLVEARRIDSPLSASICDRSIPKILIVKLRTPLRP
jgi:hypothetical protein